MRPGRCRSRAFQDLNVACSVVAGMFLLQRPRAGRLRHRAYALVQTSCSDVCCVCESLCSRGVSCLLAALHMVSAYTKRVLQCLMR